MNNNNVDILIRLIIPALFLLAWALNQVLNKEAPPQPQRGPNPDPFRNRLPPAQRPPGTLLERLERTAPPPPKPAPPLRPGQEMVIVESESRPSRPSAGSAPAGSSSSSSTSRTNRRNRNPRRPASGGGSASASSSTPKRGESGDRSRSSAFANLAPGLTDSPVNATGGMMSATPSPIEDLDPRDLAPNPARDALQQAIASPDRIRQAILINEILQPPVALRGRPRSRPHAG